MAPILLERALSVKAEEIAVARSSAAWVSHFRGEPDSSRHLAQLAEFGTVVEASDPRNNGVRVSHSR
jgi:hypothetical protein